MAMKDVLDDAVDEMTVDLTDLRRDLHSHPELSWSEERTTDVISAWMDKADISYQRFDGTGLMAEIGPPGAEIVALRADLDALPIEELNDNSWRSTVPGVSHACGHDVHTTALVGAALALSRIDHEIGLAHRVRLLFQPAEEVMPGGALKLLSMGALNDVSRIFALHCDPSLDVGQVGIRDGAITGAADFVHIVMSGRGGHTSRPHLTEDLTFALGTLLTQLPAALSRRIDPRAGASMVWGHIKAGDASNVIPVRGEISGTLRMLDVEAWRHAEELVRELIAEIVVPYGVNVEVNYIRGVPPVANDFDATELLRSAVTHVAGNNGVATTLQSLGGEDFAWYVESAPGAMGRLGTRTPGGRTYDIHQGDLQIDERAIAIGAKVLATVATL